MMIFLLIKIIIALIVLGIIVVAVYISAQGDARIELQTEKRTPVKKVREVDGRVDFEVEVPFTNTGKQEGTILDAYMRIYLPQEQYDDVLLRGKVNLKGVLRGDDYFEAMLVPSGTGNTLLLRFEAYAKNGKSIAEALKGAPDVDVALFADCRGRRELYTVKRYFTLSGDELHGLAEK